MLRELPIRCGSVDGRPTLLDDAIEGGVKVGPMPVVP